MEDQPFTIVATVNGVAPTGTVDFVNGATPLCSSVAVAAGSASCIANNLAVQAPDTETSFGLTARYSGDANQTASTSTPLRVVVLSATDVIFRANMEAQSLACPLE